MSGSEPATWKWAGEVRHCDTCGSKLRIVDVGLFHSQTQGERSIRCQGCVADGLRAFVAKTRLEMGMSWR